MLFTSLFAISAAVGAAVATPVAAAAAAAPTSLAKAERPLEGVEVTAFELDSAPQLSKRATEGVHLVNCAGNGLLYSIIVYCPDDNNCKHQPSSDNQCFLTTSSLVKWEGKTAGCAFTSGVTFSYTLPADAKSKPKFSAVGSASNGFRGFTVYNDDEPVLYTAGNGAVCRSVYYAL
jgi:hypothetical protein